jgi:hypothetical protein
MKRLLSFALAAALAVPAHAGNDLVITTKKHEDAYSMMGQEQPAKDSIEVTWVGAGRMRVEDGTKVTLVRSDLKKMMLLDTQAKTFSSIDLPLDIKKYMPAEYAPMIEQMAGQVKVTVTPTTEAKMVKDWNATRYTVTTTMPMGGSMTQEIWATQDVPLDASMLEMRAAILSANPMGGASFAAEMKKIQGVTVLTERTTSMMGTEMKAREEVQTIEQKEAPAGHYDVPADFTEKPWDPMADSGMGSRAGGRGRRGG